MAFTNPLGIKSVTGANIESLDVEKVVEECEPLAADDGTIDKTDTIDPTWSISMKGQGDVPSGFVAAAVGDLGITGITGGATIIEESKATDNNTKYNEWEIKAHNFPGVGTGS